MHAVARAMLSSAVTQGIGVATGMQKEFSWAGVAAAGVGAWTAGAVKLDGVVGKAVQIGVRTLADAATRTLIDGSDFGDNIMAALPDVIGQTIGDAVTRRFSGRSPQKSSRTSGSNLRVIENALRKTNPELFAPFLTQLPGLTFEQGGSETHSVVRGDTVELIARTRYGDNWRAGVAAIIGANDLRANENGSPLIYAGSDIALPSLSGLNLAALSRTGGAIISNNSERLGLHSLSDMMNAALSVVELADQVMALRARTPAPMLGASLGQYPVLNTMLGGNVVDSNGMTLYHRGTMLGDGLNFAGTTMATGMALTGLGVAAVELPALMLANPLTTTGLFEAAAGLVPGMEAAAPVTGLVVGGGALAHRAGIVDDAMEYMAAAACFVAGTLVHTREGLKPIELINVGDFVLAQPEFQGERAYRQVKKTFQREPQSLIAVTIASGSRREAIAATLEHPFWVKGAGWTGASDLKEGDVVELANGGEASISLIERLAERQSVFNFAVDGFHTYYIGELGVWVHNASKIGVLWRGPIEPVLIGAYTPSARLNFGSGLFGDEAHEAIGAFLRRQNPGVAMDLNVLRGQRGIDVTVLEPRGIAQLGFKWAEIKPLTLSGERTLLRQSSGWYLKPRQIQPITYDAKGNIFLGF